MANFRLPTETFSRRPDRRRLLKAAAAFGVAAMVPKAVGPALAAPAVVSQTGSLQKVKLTWNQSALCTVAVAVGNDDGIFRKHGLDIELVNFGGSTDLLLEAIGTGKADAGTGMILRWLKPLEQGFDVKLVAGVQAGCSYLVTAQGLGIQRIEDLRGKTIGVADIGGTSRNLYAIMMQNNGLDPEKDVAWKVFPDEVMPMAMEKGEIQAYVAGDPVVYYQVLASQGKLFRLASNATDEWADRTCCVLGIRGKIIRDTPDLATSITRSIIEASQSVYRDPQHAVDLVLKYSPRTRTSNIEDVLAMLKSYPYEQQPVGAEFREQVLLYAKELKRAGVLRPRTDPAKYVERITADVGI